MHAAMKELQATMAKSKGDSETAALNESTLRVSKQYVRLVLD